MGLRLAYFGLPLGAYLLARDGHTFSSVVLSPVEGPGRRRLRRVLPPSTSVLDLLEADAPAAALLRLLQATAPDLLVSWFWTRRLAAELLALPPRGGVGVHPSLLPRHRGPNPFFAAIDAGDATTGVTVHRLTPEYDDGAILAQESVPTGDSTSWQLARRLDRPSLRQLRAVVAALSQGQLLPERAQDPTQVTWAPEPSGAAFKVDWNWPTDRIARRVRALSPVPGLALEIAGARFFALAVQVLDGASARPGTEEAALRALLPGESLVGEKGVLIRTGTGALRVTLAQWAGAQGELGSPVEDWLDEGAPLLDGQELARRVATGGPAVVDSPAASGDFLDE